MKSHTFFRCICVLGMLRAVISRSLLGISKMDDDSISIEISSNNPYYEYKEGERMSFNCTMKGGDERKATITFGIEGDPKKETRAGGRHVSIEKNAEASHNNRQLSCVIRYDGARHPDTATRLITVYYSPRVAAKDLVNGAYIANGDFKVGQGANLTVRFRANPRPYMAEWTVNGNELDANRFTPLTTDKFAFVDDSWVAPLRIKEVEKSDFDYEFQLVVTNEHGSFNTLIQMENNVQPMLGRSDSWPNILQLVVLTVVLSMIAYFVWRHKNRSTSKDNFLAIQGDKQNSVEDNRMIHQSATTACTKFYIPQNLKCEEKIYKSCYDLANEVSSSKIPITIVEGSSGMGKTRCLEEIQNNFFNKKTQWMVVNLNMRIFRDDFATKLSSTSEAVTLVASKLELSNEEQQFFEKKAREELVLYLFDDVDSIDKMKLEAVLEFFELLQKVIATIRKPLTLTFKQPNVEKYSLQTLDDAQQGKFMEKLGCSQSMRKYIQTIKRDFDFGVPLYLLMIAQNALTDAKLPEEFFLTDMYKKFMENRVEKVLGEKNELHKKSKMEAILHNQAILSAFHEDSVQEDELCIRGLALTCVINGCTYFTNISIAEYLIASALVKKLYDLPDSVNILLPKKYMIKLLVSDDFSTERNFANNILLHLKLRSATIRVYCSKFLEDLECCKLEFATTIIRERLFSLSKELARNGLRLDFDQRLKLGMRKEELPVIWAAMIAANDLEISSTSSELFKFLSESGASLDSVNEKGENAIIIATKASNEPLVKLLLEMKAKIEMVDNERNCCLHLAAETGNLSLVELFASHFKVDVLNSEGVTPLMLAAFEGYLPVVQFLISKGSNVNLEAANGSTSLHYAAQGGHVEVLKVLVTKENVDSRNGNMKTPLMFSVEEGHVDAVKHLLCVGANATKVDKERNSCLHMAAENCWLELVRMFAEDKKTKILMNYPNKDKRTALHLAADYGHEEIVQYLLDKGADPDKKDKDGNTPYMLATARGHTNVAKIILIKNDDNKGKSSQLLGKR